MKLPTRFLVGAAAMLGIAAATAQPEFILPAVVLAGAAAVAGRAARQRQLAASLAEMEKRLSLTEGELESASSELGQLRVEREFDRQLLHAPKAPSNP
ncbi:MAG: hypothetical protein ACT443_08220 [Gemmatimonadota bacterium]